MKHSFEDPDRSLRSVHLLQQISLRDCSNLTFGRTELYLLKLLFGGGVAIDSWFNHQPQQSWRSPTEQPSDVHPASPKLLL
ncbi:hypothetical protein [Phormidesmis priestleyi]|uniref:hypothetical protein n=1 Tax=Phormidesmis priestleyi TaxID=268141 RepID=UPI000839E536|nr:hypothetical protein [Phormidesmis priestleyi]